MQTAIITAVAFVVLAASGLVGLRIRRVLNYRRRIAARVESIVKPYRAAVVVVEVRVKHAPKCKSDIYVDPDMFLHEGQMRSYSVKRA